MRHKLYLEPVVSRLDTPGDIEWDDETGEVTGVHAEAILRQAAADIKSGYTSYTPLGFYSEANPLKDKEAMAILLVSMGFKPPPELADLLKVDDEYFPGATY